jgi:phosphoribosylglycinamide formyltransferase-1
MDFDRIARLVMQAAAPHRHACPRLVLGVRMGLLAGRLLALDLPRTDKRLLAIAEIDGCTLSGIRTATGCDVNRRTLRIEDYGIVAATFVDVASERAYRLRPRRGIRLAASEYAPDVHGAWQAQLIGYQVMPDDELFEVQPVSLTPGLAKVISRKGARATCSRCGDEIRNGREVVAAGAVLCRACAHGAYYRVGEEGKARVDAPARPPSPSPLLPRLRLAFFASGRGSNMQAVLDACATGRVWATPCVVIGNNSEAEALARARRQNIPAYHRSGKTHPDPVALDAEHLRLLREHQADWVVLAGYMKKLGPQVLAAYAGRVINIHPALLPKFGGQGMYGRHVHAAVLAAGETETGVTVHLVDGEYDHGATLAQRRVPVLVGDTVDTLAARVLEVEHALLVETIGLLAKGIDLTDSTDQNG